MHNDEVQAGQTTTHFKVGDIVQIIALSMTLSDGLRKTMRLFNRAACRPLRIDGIGWNGSTWLEFHVNPDGSQGLPHETRDMLCIPREGASKTGSSALSMKPPF